MVGEFARGVADAVPCDPRLPLAHTFSGGHLRSIMTLGQLNPTNCVIFKEPLLYFFYGKPAYRPNGNQDPSSDHNYHPVCLLIDSRSLVNPTRIFPFDTGGFATGIYSRFIPATMKIDDFLLIPQMDMPARVVQLFYGKNINYYGGQPIKLNVASFGLGISKYYEMIRFKGKAKPDNRCSTIEVQSRTTLDLAPDNVIYIAMPNYFLESPQFRAVLGGKWRQCEIETYFMDRGRPTESVGKISQLVGQFLRRRGYL